MNINIKKPNAVYYILPITLFVIVLCYSIIHGLRHPESTASFLEFAKKFMSVKLIKVTTEPALEFVFLFIGNSFSSLFMMVGGILFGIYPLYNICNNANMNGMVIAFTCHNVGLGFTLANLLPHILTELTAFFISSGLGLWLGVKFFRKLFFHEHEEFKAAFGYSWRKFYTIVIPLLLISALIEAFVTPHIGRLFLPSGIHLLK